MGPIPGDIICIAVMDIARRWLRRIDQGFAIRRPEKILGSRPEYPSKVSPVMPERVGEEGVGN